MRLNFLNKLKLENVFLFLIFSYSIYIFLNCFSFIDDNTGTTAGTFPKYISFSLIIFSLVLLFSKKELNETNNFFKVLLSFLAIFIGIYFSNYLNFFINLFFVFIFNSFLFQSKNNNIFKLLFISLIFVASLYYVFGVFLNINFPGFE